MDFSKINDSKFEKNFNLFKVREKKGRLCYECHKLNRDEYCY